MQKKKVLIDVGHPAQVHQFKYIYQELVRKGVDVLFTAQDKEMSLDLLREYKIPYRKMDKPKKGLIKKILNIPSACIKFYKIVKEFEPDVVVSRGSIYCSWVSWLLKKDHISFADTEHVGLADTITVPFVKTKLTGYSYRKDLGKNHLRYSGNVELFYLHPKRFKANPDILKYLKVNKDEKFAIVRFVSWDAHHDVGQKGFSYEQKIKLIEILSKRMRVFITSEQQLPRELIKYKILIPPEKMHDALSYATLYIGEGGTMASEAAVLGTPSLYVNSLSMGYIEEEERAGLLFKFIDGSAAISKVKDLVDSNYLEKEFKEKWELFLHDKIDMTAFTVWFIENYPESSKIMKENPDYQYRFK